jgi:hypothetical protein
VAGVVGAPNPIRVELDAPLEVARWRPFFAWVPAIPHLFILGVAGNVIGLVGLAAWLVALFTGAVPDGLAGALAWYQRYTWRVISYVAGLREPYPAFDFTFTVADPGGDPAVWEAPPPMQQSRVSVFFRVLLAVPNAFVLCFVGIAAWFAWIVGCLAVLFTGRWPEGIRRFLVGTARWSGRLNGYVYLLTDRYPPFSLE